MEHGFRRYRFWERSSSGPYILRRPDPYPRTLLIEKYKLPRLLSEMEYPKDPPNLLSDVELTNRITVRVTFVGYLLSRILSFSEVSNYETEERSNTQSTPVPNTQNK